MWISRVKRPMQIGWDSNSSWRGFLSCNIDELQLEKHLWMDDYRWCFYQGTSIDEWMVTWEVPPIFGNPLQRYLLKIGKMSFKSSMLLICQRVRCWVCWVCCWMQSCSPISDALAGWTHYVYIYTKCTNAQIFTYIDLRRPCLKAVISYTSYSYSIFSYSPSFLA